MFNNGVDKSWFINAQRACIIVKWDVIINKPNFVLFYKKKSMGASKKYCFPHKKLFKKIGKTFYIT